MDKWYRVRARVRDRTRPGNTVLPFFSFLFFFFFFTPKFAYVVTICNSEFCYKRRAIYPRCVTITLSKIYDLQFVVTKFPFHLV